MTKTICAAAFFVFYAALCCGLFFAVAPAPMWAFLASAVLVSLCFFAYGQILHAINL